MTEKLAGVPTFLKTIKIAKIGDFTSSFRLKHFTVFSNCIKTAQQILKSNISNEFYDK